MHQDHLPFKRTGYFSSLICDYLDKAKHLQPFYNRFPDLSAFKDQIEEKLNSNTVAKAQRDVLVKALRAQYAKVELSEATKIHIDALEDERTFTITTGHQLNLFTGPLYFLYKIASTIKLTRILKARYPDYNFVPVYWMATEDHDFDEINYFNFKGKKFQWQGEAEGAVGERSTKGLDAVLDVFKQELGAGANAAFLKALFEDAYVKHDNLADATLFLANALFKAEGLVIIDANTPHLKRLFIPYIENELRLQNAYKNVSKTNTALAKCSKTYKIQVNPRAINLFYLREGLRERIVLEEGIYKVLHTNYSWEEAALLDEVHTYPERFSPNVIMRPLYQEVILPNLCYIGGGGELAYWLQLKTYFEAEKVVFPMLLLRNSALIKTPKQAEKLKRLQISNADLFLKRNSFINKKVREISDIDIDFSKQKEHLQVQFEALYSLARATDATFLGAVKAQEAKQLQGLEYLEKRLLVAQKRKLKDEVSRMTNLKSTLFPNDSLQERNTNFAAFYLEYGDALIPHLIEAFEPLQQEFSILTL